jgi:hypothetical protein
MPMMPTGYKATADAIAEQIRKRHEVHHETTREIAVREETLPADAVAVIVAAGQGTLALADEVENLKRALELVASHNVEQLRAVLDRVEAVHRASVEADNRLIDALKDLAKVAKAG